jgi:hypothetical protein
VNYHSSDSLRLVTRERLDQRSRERLARDIRGSAQHRRRRRPSVGLTLGASRRAGQPHLEA